MLTETKISCDSSWASYHCIARFRRNHTELETVTVTALNIKAKRIITVKVKLNLTKDTTDTKSTVPQQRRSDFNSR